MRKIKTEKYANLPPISNFRNLTDSPVYKAISMISKYKGPSRVEAAKMYLKDLPSAQIEEALRQLGWTGDISAFRKEITGDQAPIANRIERVPGKSDLGNARWQAPKR